MQLAAHDALALDDLEGGGGVEMVQRDHAVAGAFGSSHERERDAVGADGEWIGEGDPRHDLLARVDADEPGALVKEGGPEEVDPRAIADNEDQIERRDFDLGTQHNLDGDLLAADKGVGGATVLIKQPDRRDPSMARAIAQAVVLDLGLTDGFGGVGKLGPATGDKFLSALGGFGAKHVHVAIHRLARGAGVFLIAPIQQDGVGADALGL